jgi:hypothetical protein
MGFVRAPFMRLYGQKCNIFNEIRLNKRLRRLLLYPLSYGALPEADHTIESRSLASRFGKIALLTLPTRPRP